MTRLAWVLALAIAAASCARAGFSPRGSQVDLGGARDTRSSDGSPACALSLDPKSAKSNLGSKTLLVAQGGRAPYGYALIAGAGEIGSGGIYWAPTYPTTAQVQVTDADGCKAGAMVTVGGDYLWALGGRDANNRAVDSVYRSADGKAWSLAGKLPAARFYGAATVYEDQLWYIGGATGDEASADYPDVWASKDGNTFAQVGKLERGRYAMGASVHKGKMWIAGGRGLLSGSLDPATVQSTADGVTWTFASKLPVEVHSNELLAYGGRIWVPGGDDGSKYWADVWSSADGVTWTTSGALPSGRETAGATVFGGKLWVAGGRGTCSCDEVVSSPDGAQWTVAGHLPAAYAFGSLAAYRERLWFAGVGVEIFSSSDGATWTQEPNLPAHLEGARLVAFTPR